MCMKQQLFSDAELTKYANMASDYVKDYDQYGQPITLNYQGSDTYKTLPGGFLTEGVGLGEAGMADWIKMRTPVQYAPE